MGSRGLIKRLFLATMALCMSVGLPVQASNSDLGKERRWADQVVDGLLDGEGIWLEDGGGHRFLGIYTDAEADTQKAVILVHGIGVHPNWPDVIYPLRQGLLEQGTTTLSLQMPILANDAEPAEYLPLFDESPRRFDAGIRYLQDQGFDRIIIVAHSLGAAMATHYLAGATGDAVESLVIIGMSPGLRGNRNISALATVRVPVMDLYGSEDLEGVLNSVEQRAAAAESGSSRGFSQIRVDGANHFFQGHEADLVEHVSNWLEAR